MASLYFATVRRQICTPSAVRRSVSSRSLRGFVFSSASMMARRRFLMLSAEIFSAASAFTIALEKKVCNGNTPRSHCKYFSLTARLTVDSWILSCSAISTRRKGTSCPCGSEKKSLCFSTMASTTCCRVLSLRLMHCNAHSARFSCSAIYSSVCASAFSRSSFT